jgi:hypothetical protein
LPVYPFGLSAEPPWGACSPSFVESSLSMVKHEQ